MGEEWRGLMSVVSFHGVLGGDRMGKVRSFVPVKLTPSSRLHHGTHGFVLWESLSGGSSCRTFPLKWRGRG